MFLFSLGGLYLSHLPFPLRGQWGPACLNLAQFVSLSLSLSSLCPGLKGERHPGIWVGEEIESGQATPYVASPFPYLLRVQGLENLSWPSPGKGCVGNSSFPLLISAPSHTGAWVPHLHPPPLTPQPLPPRREQRSVLVTGIFLCVFCFWHN